MESREIISEMALLEDVEQLVSRKENIERLLEKVSFLKFLKEHSVLFESGVEPYASVLDDQDLAVAKEEVLEKVEESSVDFLDEAVPEMFTSEEDLEEDFTSEREDLDIQAEPIQRVESNREVGDAPVLEPVEPTETETGRFSENQEEVVVSESLQSNDKELINESEVKSYFNEDALEKREEQPTHEQKIRLANIKGLKTVQSLFDEELLEQLEVSETKQETSLLTEAPVLPQKEKQIFKLDLNDRIAFTKILFGGSQTELNETIQVLNQFQTLDEAKEYLSDIYYERNWKKVDEYAQRLWMLVENKFL
ncbi:hypothetical protein VQ048_02140 [Bergeyella sp. RCAD1439]|nr:hypothetical protein [Bergeyella sp. RCAD1439]